MFRHNFDATALTAVYSRMGGDLTWAINLVKRLVSYLFYD